MIDKVGLKNTFYGDEYAVIPGRATTYRSTPDGVKRNVHIDQPEFMFASSGLHTNALDLAQWFSALLDHQLISPETLEMMWKPILLNDGSVSSFANGWEYRQDYGTTIVGHGGGNRVDIRHYFRADSQNTITVIYMTNGSEKDFWPGAASAEIARIVRTASQAE